MAFYGKVIWSRVKEGEKYSVWYTTKTGEVIDTVLKPPTPEWVFDNAHAIGTVLNLRTRDKRLLPIIKPTSKSRVVWQSNLWKQKPLLVIVNNRTCTPEMNPAAALFTGFYAWVAAYLAYFGKDEPTKEDLGEPIILNDITTVENTYQASEM